MDTVDVIVSRQSARLDGPAPDAIALERAWAAAAAAPDHKRLKPWRFIVVDAGNRDAFGNLLVRSLLAREPAAEARAVERERAKAQRAPMLVVAAAVMTGDPEVPEIEQLLAAGAATENFILALHAQDYCAVWKTGAVAYCPVFKAGLGLAPEDHVLGILYVGTPAEVPPPRPRQPPSDFVRRWTPEPA